MKFGLAAKITLSLGGFAFDSAGPKRCVAHGERSQVDLHVASRESAAKQRGRPRHMKGLRHQVDPTHPARHQHGRDALRVFERVSRIGLADDARRGNATSNEPIGHRFRLGPRVGDGAPRDENKRIRMRVRQRMGTVEPGTKAGTGLADLVESRTKNHDRVRDRGRATGRRGYPIGR